MASNTEDVNSARKNIVSWDRMLRAKILLSGFWNMNEDDTGCSIELLYAKKIVTAIHIAVTHAMSKVNVCCRTGDGKSSPEGSKRDCRFAIVDDVVESNVGR